LKISTIKIIGLSALLLSSNVFAVTCTSNSNPSDNCTDLVLSNPSSEITIPIGVTVSKNVSFAIEIPSGTTTTSLVNNGTLSGGLQNVIRVDGRIETFNNIGGITTTGSAAISLRYSTSSIGTIINSGSIYAGNGQGILLYPDSQITTITNTGSIDSGVSGKFSIESRNPSATGSITNLNNSYNALTYSGNLPTNYNIIVNSDSAYGKLIYTNNDSYLAGTSTFGIYAGSLITSRLYTGVLQGLADGNVGATRTGSYDGMSWTLAISSGTSWDLTFSGVSLTQTQSSLASHARKLSGTLNIASLISHYPNSATYDCNLFDVKGMCISAGGRYSTVDNPSSNSSAAVVTLGYKVSPNIRIGGFLDQSLKTHSPKGIDISNKNPMMGAFLYWNQSADGLGYQVKIANAYQDNDLTTTRDVIGLSEAGRGTTSLNSRSYVGELSYAFMYKENTLVRPYFALRHTTIEQDAYTERGVTTPLTYSAINNRTTSALMGVKFKHALTPKANLIGSLGVEQDLHHKTGQLTASGIAGLTSENLSSDLHRTRPVASIGATYDIAKSQRLSGEVLVQQLPFQSTAGATAYFNYMIGF
jgi:hypothetical protein